MDPHQDIVLPQQHVELNLELAPVLPVHDKNAIILKCCVGSAFGSSLSLAAAYGTLYFKKKRAVIYTCLLGSSLLSLLVSDRADEDFGLLDGITALALGVVVYVPEHHFAIPAAIAIIFSWRRFIPLLGQKEDPAFSKENMAFGRLEH